MKKDHGVTFDTKGFEALIKIARKHSVDSFSYEAITVNLGTEMPDVIPEMPDTPSGMIDDDTFNGAKEDYLLTNPTMRG